jgi:ubiquinol-cytochrome c reductase cytochrome b subunit
MILMLYYIPSPTQAYSSTLYIFQNVYNGKFLETVHLYTAYAMIMLAFMHMMRGYFVSVQKKPREAMWLAGMLMGFVTLGFGFTGYLLPWTVVSKSATDVGVGMVSALPPPVSQLLTFLIVGGGGDAAELLRFFDLHVVVLPAALLILLVVKMYMLEAHGIADPQSGKAPEEKRKLIPIFPDVTLYLLEISLLFGVGMLLISAVFPLTLPAEYSPGVAAQSIPQPDWYFLWIYQVLKISIFEGAQGLAYALSVVTLIFIVLIILPFVDRGSKRSISKRPVYVTLGLIFVGEVVLLSYWGMITPGETIPVEQAALLIGGTALLISIGSMLVYKWMYSKAKSRLPTASTGLLQKSEMRVGIAFTVLVGLGALAIGSTLNSVVALVIEGYSSSSAMALALSASGLGLVVLASSFLTYSLDHRTGTLGRRVRLFERGLKSE